MIDVRTQAREPTCDILHNQIISDESHETPIKRHIFSTYENYNRFQRK